MRNADAIILNLRNNPGGSPDMVGNLVSTLTDPKANFYNALTYRDRSESERPKVPYPHPRLDVPLYVLITGRTAFAAESLAYTLQASRRAMHAGCTLDPRGFAPRALATCRPLSFPIRRLEAENLLPLYR